MDKIFEIRTKTDKNDESKLQNRKPLGSNEFLQEAEATTGRDLIPKKGGRQRNQSLKRF